MLTKILTLVLFALANLLSSQTFKFDQFVSYKIYSANGSYQETQVFANSLDKSYFLKIFPNETGYKNARLFDLNSFKIHTLSATKINGELHFTFVVTDSYKNRKSRQKEILVDINDDTKFTIRNFHNNKKTKFLDIHCQLKKDVNFTNGVGLFEFSMKYLPGEKILEYTFPGLIQNAKSTNFTAELLNYQSVKLEIKIPWI